MDEITLNPLNGLVSRFIRPKWMCKHPHAELIDRKRMVYLCDVCNPSKGGIRVLPYIKPGSSPSKVTIASSPKGKKSPKGKEEEPQSPGFK
jgi:hypothetical protein